MNDHHEVNLNSAIIFILYHANIEILMNLNYINNFYLRRNTFKILKDENFCIKIRFFKWKT